MLSLLKSAFILYFISMLSFWIQHVFECLSTPTIHYDQNKLSQHIFIKRVFLSIYIIFAFTCLQVDFSPRSEMASVIWFQMWARRSTWGQPKALQLLFKEGRKKERQKARCWEKGEGKLWNEWTRCIYRHHTQKTVWSACQCRTRCQEASKRISLQV